MTWSHRVVPVLIISLVATLAVIFTNFISFANMQDVFHGQLQTQLELETDQAASSIINHLSLVRSELVTLTKFPSFLDQNDATAQELRKGLEGATSSLLIVGRDGTILSSTSSSFQSYVGLNVAAKEYFALPAGNKEPYLSNLQQQGSESQVFVSVPIFKTTSYTPYPNIGGEFLGVAMGVVEFNDLFRRYLHPLTGSDRRFFMLVNLDTGETIQKSVAIPPYDEIRDAIPADRMTSAFLPGFLEFGDTIVSTSDVWIGRERWTLIIFAPLEHFDEGFGAIEQRILISLALVVLALGSVLLLSFSIYRSRVEIQSKLDKATVTLEKMGISVEKEGDTYSTADIKLEDHRLYLVKGGEDNNAHELFISTLNRGYAGLGIVREDPRLLREKYNLQKTSFIWMSASRVKDIPTERDISTIAGLIEEFVAKGQRSVILLERLDYLVRENGFDTVLAEVHRLRDLVRHHPTLIILSVDGALLEEKELRALEAETEDLLRSAIGRIDLSLQEQEMLRFINDQNVHNRLVVYKDITRKFDITKPTTRARVQKLQAAGLIWVEKQGRVKSLRITSLGRSII